MNDCTYIFFDESGNFDFSKSGSRYLVLTSVSQRRPFPVMESLDAYRHECLEFGLDMESFHCAKDNRHVRGRVFDLIDAHLGEICIDCLVVEKHKAAPSLRQGSYRYPKMLGYLLRFVIRKELEKGAKEFIVITDTLPFTGKRHTAETIARRMLLLTTSGLRMRLCDRGRIGRLQNRYRMK